MIQSNTIDVKVLKESEISIHFPDTYEQDYIERCPDCGSSLFYIFNEPVPEETYTQNICAVCNHRAGGIVHDWKECIDNSSDTQPPNKG